MVIITVFSQIGVIFTAIYINYTNHTHTEVLYTITNVTREVSGKSLCLYNITFSRVTTDFIINLHTKFNLALIMNLVNLHNIGIQYYL